MSSKTESNRAQVTKGPLLAFGTALSLTRLVLLSLLWSSWRPLMVGSWRRESPDLPVLTKLLGAAIKQLI